MKHLLLAFLSRAPAYGLELKRQHDDLLGAVAGPVNVGQIYTTLARLEAGDLVSHHTEQSEAGPERKIYRLTETGQKELQTWLELPPLGPEFKSEALLKIVAALHLGSDEVSSLLRSHRGSCLEGLRALDLTAGQAPRSLAQNALLQAGALHLQADLQWLDHIEANLGRGTT